MGLQFPKSFLKVYCTVLSLRNIKPTSIIISFSQTRGFWITLVFTLFVIFLQRHYRRGFIDPSFFYTASPLRVAGTLESIPADTGWEAGSWTGQSFTGQSHRDKQSTLTITPRVSLKCPITHEPTQTHGTHTSQKGPTRIQNKKLRAVRRQC